jgi:hypothetical protein
LIVALFNLADLLAGKRGDGDRIWLKVKQKVRALDMKLQDQKVLAAKTVNKGITNITHGEV